MSKLDNFLFYVGISVLLLCIILTLLLFSPKKIQEDQNLVFIGNLTLEQTKERTLSMIEEGDIILIKPKSIKDSYLYELSIESGISNPVKNFFFYNFFDKLMISSMGDTYWHVGIYIGNGKISSLRFSGIHENELDENFFNYKYFKVLRVETSEENKIKAIERANEHFREQDVYYSFKNGLILVYLESINSKKELSIKEDELICSSYISSLYREIDFNDEPFTHITPINLEFSDKTETKILVNQTGFYTG